jgi:hypothetical protein
VGLPVAGQRVAVTPPEYAGTEVHHLVALPNDWSRDRAARGQRWPVIVEYTGNFHPASGSTGKIEGAALGYGLSRGTAIWIVLPYVATDHRHNEITWWGDLTATVAYAKTQLPRICEEFGGDPQRVLLCGFSRGAIAVSLIGLHDDEIAALWCGFWRTTTSTARASGAARRGARRSRVIKPKPRCVYDGWADAPCSSPRLTPAPPRLISCANTSPPKRGPFAPWI